MLSTCPPLSTLTTREAKRRYARPYFVRTPVDTWTANTSTPQGHRNCRGDWIARWRWGERVPTWRPASGGPRTCALATRRLAMSQLIMWPARRIGHGLRR